MGVTKVDARSLDCSSHGGRNSLAYVLGFRLCLPGHRVYRALGKC